MTPNPMPQIQDFGSIARRAQNTLRQTKTRRGDRCCNGRIRTRTNRRQNSTPTVTSTGAGPPAMPRSPSSTWV
ncbi:unnamed protein product [Penicillium salamii]|nr:unnamed protein product [Penicillium salamii]CAG8153384.1 unnamed protein product [Penicillium salamii]CAG8402050.1 unnamed protein product [Penicillium salamii]